MSHASPPYRLAARSRARLVLAESARGDRRVPQGSWPVGDRADADTGHVADRQEMAVAMERLGGGPSARGPVAGRSRADGDAAESPEVLAEGLHDLVAAQVERTPTAIAVVHGPLTWTYWELDRRARQVSGQLRRMGVGPDDRVAVCLPPSPELLVGLLGVLGAGAAYVPLSARTPAERAARLLRGTQACCLVTGNPPAVPDWSVPCRVVEVPATDPTPAPDDERPARMRVHPENLAYV